MRSFKLEQSKTEILSPHAGLALVGHYHWIRLHCTT